jgi:hypothetical protein
VTPNRVNTGFVSHPETDSNNHPAIPGTATPLED